LSAQLPERPFLYPILDVALLGGRPVAEAVAAVARGGARLVQLRAKKVTGRVLVGLAEEAQQAARAADVLLIVNDRPDVARIVGADGVHVGQDDLPPSDVRRVLGAGAVVGFSTHSLAQLEWPLENDQPVDYLAVGPVFPTRTKQDADPVVGLDLVRRARQRVALPLVAIGGITAENARDVIDAGADGVAVISALLATADLEAATRRLIAAIAAAR
jgi:thiamine-phosphate pyrophosphorylase